MTPNRLRWWVAIAATVWMAGCDCSGEPPIDCTSDEDCTSAQMCIDAVCVERPRTDAAVDAGMPMEDGGGADAGRDGGVSCTLDEQCEPGVCVAGECCGSAEQVCGGVCCAASETCFAGACVLPGDTCRSNDDCMDGEYCESALGDAPDGGMPDGGTADGGMPDGGGVCLGGAPTTGRCVALPERCEGEPMPGETCIRDCEYRPTELNLDAVRQWTWNEDTAREYPDLVDVWSTPAVARLTDTNCDGVVDEFDPPNVVVVSGNSRGTCCSCGGNTLSCKTGALRVLDGQTGQEVWTSRQPTSESIGWSGVSVALGDFDHDEDLEIAAVTGEGYVAIVDHEGTVVALSDQPIPNWMGGAANGWGGGLSVADADHDGNPEIAYGRVMFSTDGATVTRQWVGTGPWGRGANQAISVFVNLDADPELELLAGQAIYEHDGTVKWTAAPGNGFSAPANFDDDPEPEIAHVSAGRIYLLNLDGTEAATSIASPPAVGGNSGGPPTIADFDNDGEPEIGVAFADNYVVVQLNDAGDALEQLWATPSHDFSSSVTGSTVFDFQGDGVAEVVYNDECYLWVYDGRTGQVRFATPTTSFTATESSLVADIDSDGSAEMLMVGNSASVSAWHCNDTYRGTNWLMPAAAGDADFGRPGWVGANGEGATGTPHRGIVAWRAADNSWVGTRSLWNQHAYSVSNICGDRGDACTPPSTYGDIPRNQVDNWSVGFLNNFRQNIQGEGIFDAPDATVSLNVICSSPLVLEVAVRNVGAAVLAAGVEVGVYVDEAGTERELGRGTTTGQIFPGQVEVVTLTAPDDVDAENVFRARILVDPDMPTFRECRDDNNRSEDVEPVCLM